MEYMQLNRPVSSSYPPEGFHGITYAPGRALAYYRWVKGHIVRFAPSYAAAAQQVKAV